MSQSLQVWVRNEKGQVFGPLTPPSVELLLDTGAIAGRVQVSTDGVSYVFPGRVPGLRMIFPRQLWGDVVTEGEALDAEWSVPVMPATLPGETPLVPMASASGVRGQAPGNPSLVAGPGARASQSQRPLNRAQLNAAAAQHSAAAAQHSAAAAQHSAAARAPAPPVSSSQSIAEIMADLTGSAAPASARSVSLSRPSAAASPVQVSSPVQVAPQVPVVPGAPQVPVVPGAPQPRAGGQLDSAGVIHMPTAGVLQQTSAPTLYALAAAGAHTGLLTLMLGDRELFIHFKKGSPEFLDSTHAEDAMDRFLLGLRLVTPEQLEQARPNLPRFGNELLPALFGMGLVNPNAVFQHLGQRATGLLFRALSAEQGGFAYHPQELPPAKAMPLGNKWSLYLEALRRVPGLDVIRRQREALDFPVMRAEGRVPLSELRLNPQETRALTYFDGVRSLRQLMHDLPNDAEVIARTAWMLTPLEVVSFAAVTLARPENSPRPVPPRAPEPARPPVAPPRPAQVSAPQVSAPQVSAPQVSAPQVSAPQVSAPAPSSPPFPGAVPRPAPLPPSARTVMPPPAGPKLATAVPPSAVPKVTAHTPVPPAAPPAKAPAASAAPRAPTPAPKPTSSPSKVPVAESLEELQALLASLQGATYFEVLNVKRDADVGAVKMAYLKAARVYHPDTVPPGSPEALAKVKADLFALIGEAQRTLSDPVIRKEYEAELDAGGTGSKVDLEKLLRAEELFQKGRILTQARRYPDALKHFEEALSLNADEPEFYAWRGYAKFLIAPDKKAAQAEVMKDLRLCVERNPNVASAHYFLGFVAKQLGDGKAAVAHFKKCVELDPRHIDAARELRTLK